MYLVHDTWWPCYTVYLVHDTWWSCLHRVSGSTTLCDLVTPCIWSMTPGDLVTPCIWSTTLCDLVTPCIWSMTLSRRVGRGVRRVQSHPPPHTHTHTSRRGPPGSNLFGWKLWTLLKKRQRWFVAVSSVLFCCSSLRTGVRVINLSAETHLLRKDWFIHPNCTITQCFNACFWTIHR